MMKKMFILITLMFSWQVFAVSSLLQNDREGASYFISKKSKTVLAKLYESHSRLELLATSKDILDSMNPGNVCAASIISKLQRLYPIDFSKKYLLALRDNNLIDDVALDIILKTYKLKKFKQRFKKRNFKNISVEQKKAILRSFTSFSKKIERSGCYTQEYRGLFNELKGLDKDKKLKRATIKTYIDFALSSKAITNEDYKLIEVARRGKVNEWRMGLSDYIDKRLKLRRQYPVVAGTQYSSYVTQKIKKQKISQRIKLYQSYDYIQIVLMGNVIQKLRTRLDSDRIEITVFNEEVDNEVFMLDPMERFRFAIKILKKEMNELSINTFFNGHRPSYTDLIVASYELGMVHAAEVDEVASLEEIWNPSKTLWEKASIWATSILSVTAALIPPPYGFIPTLAIVAIQASIQSKTKLEYEHSLF
jgi:hypothetical protein